MKRFDYLVPASLSAALDAAKVDGTVVKGAGLDLLDLMKEGLVEPMALLDLGRLPELGSIRDDEGGWEIGAAVKLADLLRHDGLRAGCSALMEAVASAATPQLREQATLGGNLCQRPRCWYFRKKQFPCWKKGGDTCFAYDGENKYHAILGGGSCWMVHPSSLAPALIVLGAVVILKSASGSRELPAEDFFVAPEKSRTAETVLAPGEIVFSVRIPKTGAASAFLDVKEKQSFDWPLAMAAAARDGTAWRICLGAVAPVPWRSLAAERILEGEARPGSALARAAAEAALKDAVSMGQNGFRIKIARTVVERVVLAAAGREVSA